MKISFKEHDVNSDVRYKLANSIYFAQGKLYICTAYGEVISLDLQTGSSSRIGKEGFGKFEFKQPVFIGGDQTKNEVYVADWYNHRVIVYDHSMRYKFEFGSFKDEHHPKMLNFLRQIRLAVNDYKIIQDHTLGIQKSEEVNFSFLEKIRMLTYFLFKRKVALQVNFYKPNGVLSLGNKIVVTEKNNRSLAICDVSKKHSRKLKGAANRQFGRLGNIFQVEDGCAVCDEERNSVLFFDNELELIKTIQFNCGFGPFCGVEIETGVSVIGGMDGCRVINSRTKKIEALGTFSEVHGITVDRDNKVVFVLERDSGKITKLGFA